jgi:radical SAM superfamily enzyme YgiQ (UPF0313 family)
MKVTLISPAARPDFGGHPEHFRPIFPPLALPTIAAETPPGVDVSILDEAASPFDVSDLDCDLAGLSVTTAGAPRAYEMADRMRERGIKVVMGGVHPSALPQESLRHADAVVVGEAEPSWPRLIEDFKARNLQPIYISDSYIDLGSLPIARRDLLDESRYIVGRGIQASRGCPYDCSFCSVSKFFGACYRWRPVESVIAELETMKTPGMTFFVDDNIVGRLSYAKSLFAAVKELGISWFGQASITVARSLETLKVAAKSGCRGFFIGFESLSAENLRDIGKNVNLIGKFKDAVKKIHDHGISVIGAFIFGFDGDDKSIFDRTLDFAIRTKIDLAQFTVLTPFPGTRLYERLESEGRIFERDWSRYDVATTVFRPKKMTPEELNEGIDHVYRTFYSGWNILRRNLPRLKDLPLRLTVNWIHRKKAFARFDAAKEQAALAPGAGTAKAA